ncbi:unnamed protein product [Mucor fragilis]
MGRVRTKTVKKASRVVIEKYYPRLTLDFQVNKKILDEVSIIQSKRLRNKIAGFTTHLMKRISRGPVRGISFKLQEEERERRDNYVPEFSALDTSNIEVDPETEVSFFFLYAPFGNRKLVARIFSICFHSSFLSCFVLVCKCWFYDGKGETHLCFRNLFFVRC